MIFNQRARDLREDMELTQDDIANQLGVSRVTVNRYENDKYDMKLSYAIKLCEIYNVSLDYLSGITDEKKPYPKK